MKIWTLLGCLLTLTACGQFPQERYDLLKERIVELEENGVGIEMPEEFAAVQDAFAEVQRLSEVEKEKTFASYGAIEQEMQRIETRLESLAETVHGRYARYRTMYERLTRETGLGLLLFGRLSKDQARTLPEEMKESVQRAARPMLLVRELMQAETFARKMEILSPLVEKQEEMNAWMKSRLPDETYEECLKKVESQQRNSNAAPGNPFGTF